MKGVGDLFDGYGEAARGLTKAAFDEMVGHDGTTRSPYAGVASSLSQMGPEDVSARATRLARAFMDQGVTFDLDGEERPFPLDVVPRIFTASEWKEVSTGVAQRVRALEAFLSDVYGAARIVSDGLIPHEVITSSPGFVRAAFGLAPPNGVRIHVAGIDVIRDEEGEFRVLEDNVRSPSGVSYVLANRAAMARVLPELFWGQPIQMVTDYPAHLINALRRAAPTGVQDPTVVVLTPGVHNSAFYEHALLARLMGVHLVEGRDLVCHGTEVFLRTTEGEVPVHVIYRRIDDDYLDPLQFRPESLVGCPGVVNAARAGRVTITNGVGNGVADDKLVYAYVPAMIKYYLGEDPILQNVETMHLQDAAVRADALSRRDELVFKRVDGSGGKGLVIGTPATGQRAGPTRPRGGGRATPMDRPACGRALDFSHLGGHRNGAPPCRPAPLRGQRRRERVGPPRGSDPGGPARGRPGRELQPGRRLQGHLGGGRGPSDARAAAPPGGRGQRKPAHGRRAGRRLGEPQPTATATATATAAERQQQHDASPTEPGGRVDLLGRPLRRASRGHGAHPRRVGLPGARAERHRRGPRRPPAPGRHGPARQRERDAVAGDRAAGHRPQEPLFHRRRPGGRPREHPGCAPRRARRVLGAHQRHVVGPSPPMGGHPPSRVRRRISPSSRARWPASRASPTP